MILKLYCGDIISLTGGSGGDMYRTYCITGPLGEAGVSQLTFTSVAFNCCTSTFSGGLGTASNKMDKCLPKIKIS
jgi:hypothetical protein